MSSSERKTDDRDFQASILGTKEHWDDVYTIDLKNYNATKSDECVGDIWFGESSQSRVMRWLETCPDVTLQDPILDLGCGNGMMLIEMHREGYCNLTGVDYSEQGIQLARDIAENENIEDIKYEVADLLSDVEESCLRCNSYKLCLDKGTYDAISLMHGDSLPSRRKYSNNVRKLLRSGGLFVVTSANWTRQQLQEFFKEDFSYFATIPTPEFQYGGQVGNSVTSIVFKLEDR